MKLCYFIPIILLFILGGSQSPYRHDLNKSALSGNISLTLQHGLWKLWEEKPVYQDITLDLVCDQGKCQSQVWGHGPSFNQEVDHQGTVEVIPTENSWKLKVNMGIQSHPWKPEVQPAEYIIELIPQKNKLIGSYSGNLNQRRLQGKVQGEINPYWPVTIPQHQPITPQEHPRLIFRKNQLPQLQAKAKTKSGQAILTQLEKSLNSPIYYDGYGPNSTYHAAGHCFLYLLNNDLEAAATAWDLVHKSISQPELRILEQSSIVAGVALAYDMCYDVWDEQRLDQLTSWLAMQTVKLINGDSPSTGWNSNSHSNWNAKTRSSAGLASLAIIGEPESYFPNNKFFSSPSDAEKYFYIAQRNIQRYLNTAIGDRGFGTEGDLYTRESVYSILPFIVASRNVLGQDLVTGSSAAEWLLPHYLTRMVGENGAISLATYGRHRAGPDGSLFALGLGIVPDKFLPGVQWFFNRQFGLAGNQTFGVGTHNPIKAAYILSSYQEDTLTQNPAFSFPLLLLDQQKGFLVFRNQWDNKQDFVASIYLKTQPLSGSWSFPEVGSFRIWGLGEQWAIAGPGDGTKESENIVVMPNARKWRFSQPAFFASRSNGSGIISMKMDNLMLSDHNPPLGLATLRSFAVDYSGVSGSPGLFVVVDRFTGAINNPYFQNKTWTMYTQGQHVSIDGQSFTIHSASGATMTGTFITPASVNISYSRDHRRIEATGGDQFFVVMTVQHTQPPQVNITGYGLNSVVTIGQQTISFQDDQIIFSNF